MGVDLSFIHSGSISKSLLQHKSGKLQREIDRMLIEKIWAPNKYLLIKSWQASDGRKMHRIGVDADVFKWLTTEHSQYGISNPDWWKFEDRINITDKLYTLLILRWAE